MKKIIRLGFDLDGVLVNKPPFVSRQMLEWLFKGRRKGLHYRFPKTKIEQWIRRISHFYLFRPPIKKNIALIKKIAGKRNYELYLISSRYSFLEKETYTWLKKRKIDNLFAGTHLNLRNEQPHVFKERRLKKLAVDVYFEDDLLIVDYLRRKLKRTRICWLDRVNKSRLVKKLLKDIK